ncbi:DUF448 domain-containing protein [Desulfuromonas carbonis]|uniref:DUF448 domain-containing protein n=1 Tax=Desulfuromonas sp. DDH964 TaxID=1823759 RepID=UPI00078C4A0A|nr:YlxR family protein [Desulfuromonas sp. DDH964]AMV72079.1 RNA-binding protein YlxRQ [Desulfuromonas sp. DDH964]
MGLAGHSAERTCIGCRKTLRQGDLVRYVLAPDGTLLVDYRHRLPGRGAYTCPEPGCIAAAVRRGQFARAFRRPLPEVTADDLLASLKGQIWERIHGLISMARKAGQILSGSNLVLDAMTALTPPALVLVAKDISAGVGDKITGKAAACGIPCWHCFDKDTFGRLLGKEERSVIAVRKHSLAVSMHQELIRYTHIAGEN